MSTRLHRQSRRVLLAGSASLLVLFASIVPASADTKPAAGKLLVAARSLEDPNFYRTVILLVQYGEEGTMGVIINRSSDVSPSSVLPDIEELERYAGVLYVGGPVALNGILVLIRAWDPPETSENIFGDVHITGDRDLLRELIDAGLDDADLRIYAGYSGWSPGQLDNEISRGDWHLVPATEDLVFSEQPQEIWQQLAPSGDAIIADLVEMRPSL